MRLRWMVGTGYFSVPSGLRLSGEESWYSVEAFHSAHISNFLPKHAPHTSEHSECASKR